MTFPFPAAAPPTFFSAGAFTYVGADRTASSDGDLIVLLQYAATSTAPALPTGYTSVVTVVVNGGRENAEGEWSVYGYASMRVCYATSSSATRTTAISGTGYKTLVIASPFGSGANTVTVTSVPAGSVSTEGYGEAVGFLEVGVDSGSATTTPSANSSFTAGTVDATSRDYFIQHNASAGRDAFGNYDAEVSFWDGNFTANSTATLVSGTGVESTSVQWFALGIS